MGGTKDLQTPSHLRKVNQRMMWAAFMKSMEYANVKKCIAEVHQEFVNMQATERLLHDFKSRMLEKLGWEDEDCTVKFNQETYDVDFDITPIRIEKSYLAGLHYA